jgi:predicted SAM-dependent methyltransferase
MGMTRAAIKRMTSAGVRRAAHELATELGRLHRHLTGVRRARALARRRPIRLNLGSGSRSRTGWIDVDLGERSALTLDLREPLPFPDQSVEAIYSEHFFEHLNYAQLDESTAWTLETDASPSEALAFLRECRRVLIPGGVLDLVVPDAACIVSEYAARNQRSFPQHPWWGPAWCDTPLHCVNYVFRQGSEHRYAYDEETLGGVLTEAGFADVARRPFDPAVDAANHAIGSLCVQARNPATIAGTERKDRRSLRGLRHVARALRNLRSELYVQRLHRAAVRKARDRRGVDPVRLNLGSGFHPKPGWINVDLIDGADLQLDLRERLPFADGSASQIYSEHFFEHLSLANTDDPSSWQLDTPGAPSDAITLLRECRRVLAPGGRLDIVVPDAEAILDAYALQPRERFVLADWWGPPWADTPMHRVNYLFRQGTEHLYAYDFETLGRVLERAGFNGVSRRGFDPLLDYRNPSRSLFVCAFRPSAREQAA